MPSRRHVPAPGPVRLSKSGGEFTPKNILTRARNVFAPKVDKFTAGGCLSAQSQSRPTIRNMSCNYGQCPGGYISVGYDGTEWNYGSACKMYNMICVKSNYNTDDWMTVANCCNGVTAQKDCDPSLCVNSQACRDKMTSTTWCDSRDRINNPNCVKYLNANGNEDVKQSILARNCTAVDMAGGICRDWATSGKAHGQMDKAVISWCTDKLEAPPTVDPQLTEWALFRFKKVNRPWINMMITRPDNQAFQAFQQWDAKMNAAIRALGSPDAVMYPPVVYRDNSKDPICACILSQLNKSGEKTPPVACFDSACQLTGYQTNGMKTVAANCPSWVDCRSTVLAASSGTVDNVRVNQVCGEPPAGTYIPPITTPSTSMPAESPTADPSTAYGGIKDDKTLLKEDESRANLTAAVATPIINLPGIETISQQLSAPFAPNLFGNTSVAEVAIVFFALLILSAILYRVWMNRQAKKLIQGQYEAAIQYDKELELADQTQAIKESIAAMNVR